MPGREVPGGFHSATSAQGTKYGRRQPPRTVVVPPTRGHTRTGPRNESGSARFAVTSINSAKCRPLQWPSVPKPPSSTCSVSEPSARKDWPATSSCQMPMAGPTASSAAAASSRPQPVIASTPGSPMSCALSRSTCLKSTSVSSGRAAASRPTAPVTNGAANEVPATAT